MTATLVDRQWETARLTEALDRTVHDGTPEVLLLRGEAGVGKSRLLHHFVDLMTERHAEAGLLAGYGQAMMNSLGSDAYQAVRDCLRTLTQRAERTGSRATLARVAESFRLHAPDWIESVPVVGKLLAAGILTGRTLLESGDDAGGAGGADAMDSRLDQLAEVVNGLVEGGPVLLVLDDLHWADTATIDLVMRLALQVRGPLLLVLAYRPDDLQTQENADGHPLRRAVYRLRRYSENCFEIDLERLSRDHTEELVRVAAGGSVLPPGTLERILRESDGNPLFAESLLRVGDGARRERRPESMPRQIKAILEERLSYLSAADQRLLEAAALIGYSFEVDYLAALVRMDVDDVYERLDVLLNEFGLVRPDDPRGARDRYAVHHPLLAEVLRERGAANAPRWQRMHARLLEALDREGEWDDELWVRAVAVAVGAGRADRARELALEAARRQFQLGAVSKARELAQVAAEGAVPASRRAAFRLLAECMSVEGDHRGAAAACAEAMRAVAEHAEPAEVPAVTADSRFAVGLLWARSLRMTNDWSRCRDLLAELEAGCADAGPADVLAQVRMLEAELALCGPAQDTDECVRLCSLVYDMTSDPELQARALGHRGLAYLAGYDAESAEMWLNRAIEVARRKRHPYAEYEAVHWLSKKTIACLELDRAADLLRRLTRMSQASGVASDSPFHLRDSSRVLALQRDFAGAAAAFARYFEIGPGHWLDRATTTLACQVHELEVLYGRGAADALTEELLRAADRETTDGDRRTLLKERIGGLAGRGTGWHPVETSVSLLAAHPDEAAAADAIFRFDIADIAALRARIPRPRDGGPGAN
ncbi:AAA family ATPase [Spirillospora sp. NPDC052242]